MPPPPRTLQYHHAHHAHAKQLCAHLHAHHAPLVMVAAALAEGLVEAAAAERGQAGADRWGEFGAHAPHCCAG